MVSYRERATDKLGRRSNDHGSQKHRVGASPIANLGMGLVLIPSMLLRGRIRGMDLPTNHLNLTVIIQLCANVFSCEPSFAARPSASTRDRDRSDTRLHSRVDRQETGSHLPSIQGQWMALLLFLAVLP